MRANIQAEVDIKPELYDELWRTEQSHWWFQGRREIIRSLVDRFGPQETTPPIRICELGCGTGGNIASWADQHDVVGVDASREALRFARRRLGSRVKYGRLPHDVPLARDSFDVVLMTDVLEHIEDDVGSAREAISLLREGGILVSTVPAHQWLYSPRDRDHHHKRRYSKDQFRRLFDVPGTRLELVSFYNSFLYPPAAVARLWSKLARQNAEPGDLRVPPTPINEVLTAVFSFEKNLLGRMRLPCGLSLIAVARKYARRPMAAAA